MENLDFSGATDISQLIDEPPLPPLNPPPPPPKSNLVIEEKKLDESQMMEFSSSVSDLMPVMQPPPSQDIYTNPTNGRVSGISINGDPSPQKRGSQNPFNLTDDQFNAAIAGIVAVLIFSTAIQTKLAGIVPNFSGLNGNIASAIAAAILFYFAHKFIKNR